MHLMQELFDRHPERILLWRTIWQESVRVALTQGCGGGLDILSSGQRTWIDGS